MNSSSRYQIKLYDMPLIEFDIISHDSLLGEVLQEITDFKIISDQFHLFPYGFALSEKSIMSWLRNRMVPKNRRFVDRILESSGIKRSDVKGFIDITKGLSLNDSYWVVSSEFQGTFSEYNLYENPFDKVLSLVAYTGYGYDHKLLTTSPEPTTGGMLAKAWRMDSDGIFLYKSGSEGFANSGLEPYSEFYASKLAQKMNLNAVEYDLVYWKGKLASKCRLFTDLDTSYVPIGEVVESGGIDACIEFCDGLSPEFGESLRSMLVFDALVYQEDRHFGNFGFLRDNRTGKFIEMAPIFDNGLSLFNFAMDDDLQNVDSYASTRTPPYRDKTYGEICRDCMGRIQHEMLRRILNFSLDRHPTYNLPEKRLAIIEKHLSERVREMLKIPVREKVAKERSVYSGVFGDRF